MAKKRVADVLVDTLIAADVKRVYGLVGDSLNGVTDSIRPRKDLQSVPVRRKEKAAFAAGAGYGRPVAWIAADIVRIEDGRLAEHWDVLQGRGDKSGIEERPANVWRSLHWLTFRPQRTSVAVAAQ